MSSRTGRPRRSRLPLFLAALALAALGGATISDQIVPSAGAAATPKLTLSPTSGPAGVTVTLTGEGFPGRQEGQVVWAGQSAGMPRVRIHPRGSFSTQVTAPSRPAGTDTVSVTVAGVTGSALFTVTGSTPSPTPSSTPTPTPTPTASPTPMPAPTPTPTPSPGSCAVGQHMAEYYGNRTLSGTPSRTQCEGSPITYDWGQGGPAGVATDQFSVRWTGRFSFSAGTHTFTAVTNDGMRVWVDGSLALDKWFNQAATTYTFSRTLSAGEHEVKVEFYEDANNATAKLSWAEGTAPTPAPTTTPAPTMTPAPTTTPTATPSPTPTATATPSTAPGTDCSTSLQTLVNNAASGSTLNLPACIFRESVTITKALTLQGQAGTEIRGSAVITGWTASSGRWTRSSLPSFTAHGECWSVADWIERCHRAEGVWINGVAQRQVASSPAAGQFSTSSGTYTLGSDPTGKTVEVAMRDAWVTIGANNVLLKDITMRHAANRPQEWAAVRASGTYTGFVAERLVLEEAHGAAISAKGLNGGAIRSSIIRNNGNAGIHGTAVNGFTIAGNTITGNNMQDFDPGWEAGGIKIATQASNVTVTGNDVLHNRGAGIWFDIRTDQITITQNRVHHNLTTGIFFEISSHGTITDNIVYENGFYNPAWGQGAGIMVHSSNNVEVARNVVAWNADGIVLQSQNRSDRPGAVTDITFRDNTVVMKSGSSSVFLSAFLEDYQGYVSEANRIRGYENKFWTPSAEGGEVRFSYGYASSIPRLSDYNGTPGENNGRYLTASEKDNALNAAAVPLAPER